MSKVMIVRLNERTYKDDQPVMSWEEYLKFQQLTEGEGVLWKAVLI